MLFLDSLNVSIRFRTALCDKTMPSIRLTTLSRRFIATMALLCLLISTTACNSTSIEELPQIESVSDQLQQQRDRPASIMTTDTLAPSGDTPSGQPDSIVAPLDDRQGQVSDERAIGPIAAEDAIETKSLEIEQALQAEQAEAAAKLKAANEAAAAALNAELEKATTTFDKELNAITDEFKATPTPDNT